MALASGGVATHGVLCQKPTEPYSLPELYARPLRSTRVRDQIHQGIHIDRHRAVVVGLDEVACFSLTAALPSPPLLPRPR